MFWCGSVAVAVSIVAMTITIFGSLGMTIALLPRDSCIQLQFSEARLIATFVTQQTDEVRFSAGFNWRSNRERLLTSAPWPGWFDIAARKHAPPYWWLGMTPLWLYTLLGLGAMALARPSFRSPTGCPSCGYDTSGSAEPICPECGTTATPSKS